jgi:hypothetical protein
LALPQESLRFAAANNKREGDTVFAIIKAAGVSVEKE